jgi:hypothetical protein
MQDFSADFVVSAVTQFVEDASHTSREKPLTDLNKLDSLVAELEKQLFDKNRTESAVTVASALPILTSNTKELMHAVERAKQLVKRNSRCVASQLQSTPKNHREMCSNCENLVRRLETVEVENHRLREIMEQREASSGGTATLPDWQPARVLRSDPVDELEELETALTAVESLKSRFDRFTNN